MRYRYRSAVTGLFVTFKYALGHPRTTLKEHVRKVVPWMRSSGG